MEIPAFHFFLFWGVISFFFLNLGLYAIQEETELSNSVSPVVMSFLKFFLTVSSNWSYTYALTYNRHTKISINKYVLLCSFFRCVFCTTYVSILYLNLVAPTINSLSALFFFHFGSLLTTGAVVMIKLTILALVYFTMFRLNKIFFTGMVALSIFNLVYPQWKEVLEDEWLHYTRPTTDLTEGNRKSKIERWVEFAVGMVGTIVFQSFFRLTSFRQAVAFFYFAVAWLANIVLVSASHDLGVFNFLLGNVIVGCTVSEYGFRGTTWIAYGAAVVLYGLRLKFESVELVDREGKETQVQAVIW